MPCLHRLHLLAYPFWTLLDVVSVLGEIHVAIERRQSIRNILLVLLFQSQELLNKSEQILYLNQGRHQSRRLGQFAESNLNLIQFDREKSIQILW